MATIPLQPYVVELPFQSQKHRVALEYVMKRVYQARKRRTGRMNKWADAENLFCAYVKETEVDARRRVDKREQGKPVYTTVTIPYSYATLLTAHTYWTSVFLARDPVHQVQGNTGQAEDAESAVEALLSYYVVTGNNLVPYYIWLMDQGKYGEGILGMTWDVERHFVPQAVQGPRMLPGGIPIPGTMKKSWVAKEVLGYEGIRLFNVRPHDFLFDPNVTLSRFQDGEYAGHDGFVSMIKLKDGAAKGLYFNTECVEERSYSSTMMASGSNSQVGINDGLPGSANSFLPGSPHGDGAKGFDLTEITIELVPRDLGLAPRDYLEKWTFSIANDCTIIGCQPQGWYHNQFMYDVMEHEIEGYNVSKRGMLEMLQALNQTLDWLFNSHMYNVRKVLNDNFIYDPSILVSKDVENPGPGKLIRVRPERYGTDVRTALFQLQTTDITQNNMRDAQLVIDMMQRLTGVNDSVMGMLNNTRRTATEVRTSSSFAVNRLKTQCEYYSAMGFAPHTGRMIKVAQQMLAGKQSRAYRAVGNQSGDLARFVNVGPDEIAGSFDYIPVDGTMPIDRQAQASVFSTMLQQMAQIPQVAQSYDWARLFGYNAQLLGIRNLERFKVQVVPDQQAMADAQAGNTVPMTQTSAGSQMNAAGMDPAQMAAMSTGQGGPQQ